MNMKGRKHRIAVVAVVLLALLLLSGGAFTQAGSGYQVNWWTVDGGGGSSSAGQLNLNGTVGQSDAGMLSGDSYELHGGFWTAATQSEGDPSEENYTLSLPLIVGGD